MSLGKKHLKKYKNVATEEEEEKNEEQQEKNIILNI